MPHDWPTLHGLYQKTVAELEGLTFVRAIVTKDGMTLIPQTGESVVLPEFYCRGDAMTAHFAACILNHVGLGEFQALRAFLGVCNQLIALRVSAGVVLSAQLRCA